MALKCFYARGYRILAKARNEINLGQRLRQYTNDNVSPSSQTVTLDNQTMHFEQVGNGKNHLFLIPGALGSSRTDFAKQLEKLNRDKFTIVAWDPPGYGKSRPPDRQFSLDFFHQDAKAAAALLKHLNVPKTNVIGWSDGGMVALILAAQNVDLVKKLVVFGSNAYISEKDIQLYEAVRDINKWSERMKKPMIDMYGEEYFRSTWNAWIDTVISMYKKNQGDICRKELKQIKCPTLIIHGKKDPMVPRFHPIFIKENIPTSKFVEWEDAKHNLHVQYADRFNEIVEKFILS